MQREAKEVADCSVRLQKNMKSSHEVELHWACKYLANSTSTGPVVTSSSNATENWAHSSRIQKKKRRLENKMELLSTQPGNNGGGWPNIESKAASGNTSRVIINLFTA